MSNWKYKLKIKDEWEKLNNDKITRSEFSQIVISKLEAFNITDDEELDDIIFDLELIDNDTTTVEFDWIWNDLYNWADQEVPPYGKWPKNKMCWIETF